MYSGIRYTFFAEYVENVKYSFTPRFLREFKVFGNIFFKKSICRRKLASLNPSFIARERLPVNIICVEAYLPSEILILFLKTKSAYIAYLFFDELVDQCPGFLISSEILQAAVKDDGLPCSGNGVFDNL